MKKKIKPEDLNLSIEDLSTNESSSNRDSLSEGTGTLCISVVYCAETEKNCEDDSTLSKAAICCDNTQDCIINTQVCLSDDYCQISNECAISEDTNCLATTDCIAD
jgi:hypothetical protein